MSWLTTIIISALTFLGFKLLADRVDRGAERIVNVNGEREE